MRDILVLALVIWGLWWTFRRPWIGILNWNWISLQTPHMLTWGFMNSVPVAAIGVGALLTSMLFNQNQETKPLYFNLLSSLVIILCIHTFITTMDSWVFDRAWPQWIAFAKIAFVAFLSTKFIFGKNRIYWYVFIIAVSLGLLGIRGALFTLTTAGQFNVMGPRTSFLADRNHFALGMNMGLPFMYVLLKHAVPVERFKKGLKYLLWFCFLSTIVSIIFTYSRGGFIGFTILVLYTIYQSKHKLKLTVLAFIVFLAAIPFIPDRLINRLDTINTYQQDQSANQRMQAWEVAYNIAKENPLTGAGYHYYRIGPQIWLLYTEKDDEGAAYQVNRAEHSIYFQMMGQHGFVGLFIFLFLLASTFFQFVKSQKYFTKNDNMLLADFALAGKLSLVVFGVCGALLNAAFFDFLYMIVFLAVFLHREQKMALEGVPKKMNVPLGALHKG